MFRFRLLLLCIIVLFIFIFTICTLSRCGLSTWIKVLINWLTVMTVSVCVCLCLCLRAYLRNQKPDLQNILRFITRLSQGHRIKNKQLKIVTYDVEYEEQTDDSKHAYQNCDAMQRMPCNKKVCRQLPTSLTIWHSLPHLLLRAVLLRRGCCWPPAWRRCSNRSISPGRRTTAANPQQWRVAAADGTNGQTDGRTHDSSIDPALHTMRSAPIASVK